jgi:AcrR family transcriptional regulator
MATVPTAETSPRRTQAERSEATREALLDATIESLVEDGYARTTTGRVAERAGLSRGAHLHHFQTREALVAAAVERLARRRSAEQLAAVDALPEEGRERVAAGLDFFWSNYANPLFQAALDLWTAARTDAELRGALVKVERELDRQTLELARRLFPDLADRPDFERLIEMAAATARGLSLLDTLNPDSDRNRKQWEFCRAKLVELFEEPSRDEGTRAGAPKQHT